MKKIMRSIISHLSFFFLACLPFFLISGAYWMHHPEIWPDEAIFLNSAFSLVKNGSISTSLFGDVIPGLSKHALWYPPLYFYSIALPIALFGQNIEIVRFLSIIYALLALFCVYFLGFWWTKSKKGAVIAVFILGLDFSFTRAGQVARMDMMSVFLILLSLVCINYWLRTKKIGALFLSALVASLAVVTHPLGLIAPITVVIWIIMTTSIPFRYRFYHILMFCVTCAVFPLIWLITLIPHWDIFITQWYLQFLRKELQLPHLYLLLLNDPPWTRWIIGSLFILIFGIGMSFKNRLLLYPLSAILIAVVAMLWGKEMWYSVYIVPFLALIAALIIVEPQHRWMQFSVLIVVGFVIIQSAYLIIRQNNNLSYSVFSNDLIKYIPEGSSVLLSAIPDPYFGFVKNNRNYKLYEFPTVPVKPILYERLLDSVDYYIVTFYPDETLEKYIKKNTEEIATLTSGGYDVQLFRSKSSIIRNKYE